jgi:hypothetical protein
MRRRVSFCVMLALNMIAAAVAQDSLKTSSQISKDPEKLSNFQFPISLSRRHLRFVFTDAQLQISLPDSLVIAGSDSLVYQKRHLQRGKEYVMELANRQVRLLKRATGDTLDIHYQVLPVGFSTKQFLFSLGAPAVADTFLPVSGIVRPSRAGGASTSGESVGANLNKSGSLVRGISIGTNQALKVDSGLRLQISGRVANKVDVVAALTDQNTPIQPEGNTQTLQEIDKVFVQLKGENVRATLGDYELSFADPQSVLVTGEFTRYARKLQGAMVAGEFGPAALILSAAASRGRFTTNEFRGSEGNQGPYQLTGDRGQIDILVLAGTEKVWLDGVSMTRGESNDYVIEYGNGQITFTRNRLITADSRITVDFQFSDERFRRSLYAAAGGYRMANDRVRVQGALIREADDQDNPLAFSLSPEDRDSLAAAGDGLAFRNGARQVDPGAGAYVLENGIYRYLGAGSDSGNYNVTFSDVGQGLGDYAYEAFGNYKFVGKNRGRYAPVILLTPAQRRDLIDGRVELRPWSSFSMVNELAISSNDLNLYSPQDDGDNVGRAWLTHMSWQPTTLRLSGRNLGKAFFQLRYRSRGERYRDLDRSETVEFNRRWDIARQNIFGEDILETSARYEPAAGLSAHGGFGRLNRSDDLKSNRWEAGTEWTRPRWPSVSYRVEQIRRTAASSITGNSATNDWRRQRGNASYSFGRLKPSFDYEGERKTDADTSLGGFRFNSYSAGLNLLAWRKMTASANVNYRRDDLGAGKNLSPYSKAITQHYEWALESWRALSASFSFTHRERDFANQITSDTRTDLADARIRFSPWQRALSTDWHYQITNTQAARQERVFIKVPAGQGNYSFKADLNEYVPDPFGDFVLRIIPTDDFVPVVEVRASATWRFSFAALQRQRKSPSQAREQINRLWRWLSSVSTETQIRIEEKTTEPEVGDIYRLNLRRFLSDSTLFGSQNLRQDIYLWENNREQSFRYRLNVRRERSRQFLEGALRLEQIRHEFRLTAAWSPQTSGRFEYIRNHEDRTFKISGRQSRLLRGNALSADLSHRPQPDLELAIVFGLNLDEDKFLAPATEVRALLARPRAVYSFRRRGRLRSEIEWVDVKVTPSGRILPFELAGGNRAGKTVRWNFSFEYRLSANFQMTASYDGRREPDRPQTLHLGKIEMRAFF